MSLSPYFRFAIALVVGCLGVVVAAVEPAQADDAGQAAFAAKCAACHGAQGEGVAGKYEKPLHGELSVEELAAVIERTMPQESPEDCVGEEARQIAAHMHGAFYSPQARGLATPRIELARLTVPQYRNALADLLGRFTPQPKSDRPAEQPAPAGLSAEYFQSKGMSKTDQLKQERIDPRIDFDFGTEGPNNEIDASQFAIVWNGSLVADHTGYYEFRVTTPNGARLYLNNDPTPERRGLRDDSSVAGQAALIDGWVSSGGELREQTARVFLLGGRRYPIRLEFFKYKEKTASIRLEWKPPYGTWSVLDDAHLVAEATPRTFVIDTPFPADDRSLGYERGSSVSRGWHEATTSAAIATSDEVVARLGLLGGIPADGPERDQRIRDFLVRFATAAFRRPLTDEEQAFFREHVFANSPTVEASIRRAVILTLTSPHFLYTDLTPAGEPPSQHAIAARLAWSLWDSLPDEQLSELAAQGQLGTPEQIAAQARRMMADPRARAKMREFFQHWLELDERDLAKDGKLFPEFDEGVVADLRTSLELFVEQVVWSEASDYRQLLLADYLVLNERLAKLYGLEVAEQAVAEVSDDSAEESEDAVESEKEAEERPPSEPEPTSGFRRYSVSPEQRCGVLTHPYLLSAFAYHNSTSPIHRGVFLTRNIVGRHLNPPPVAVAFDNESFAPDLTMREKITQLTRDKACMACHSIINPLGFALEHYDAVGRWRTEDNQRPVDTKSEYVTADGEAVEIQSPRDIANFAVASPAASQAFVSDLFHHLTKQDTIAYGPLTLDRLRDEFAANGYNIHDLCVAIATLAAGDGLNPTAPKSETQP